MKNNKPKWTPGPWKYDYFPENDYKESRLTNNKHQVIINDVAGVSISDAHLIAAAPCLLRSLEKFMDRYKGIPSLSAFDGSAEMWAEAKAAITKAKGEGEQ